MKGMKYKIAIAINGVISKTPSLGITRLKGDKIGSVTSSSKVINRLSLLIINHESITRTKITNVNIRHR